MIRVAQIYICSAQSAVGMNGGINMSQDIEEVKRLLREAVTEVYEAKVFLSSRWERPNELLEGAASKIQNARSLLDRLAPEELAGRDSSKELAEKMEGPPDRCSVCGHYFQFSDYDGWVCPEHPFAPPYGEPPAEPCKHGNIKHRGPEGAEEHYCKDCGERVSPADPPLGIPHIKGASGWIPPIEEDE
jgi:hypothetical protein